MKLVHYNDPILKSSADLCRNPGVDMINEMIEMAVQEHLLWLAGPQIGVSQRLFVAHLQDDWDVFINPEVAAVGPQLMTVESDPHSGIKVAMKQYRSIVLIWEDLSGVPQKKEFTGLNAAIVQNAMRFLDGKAFDNREQLGDWDG